jgi:hypothetical protein
MCRRLHPGILGDVLVLRVSALTVAKAIYHSPRTHESENAVEDPSAQLCLRVCAPQYTRAYPLDLSSTHERSLTRLRCANT